MRYTPKLPKENLNISKKHPLKEFLKLLSGLLLIVFAVYIILGFCVDLVIPHLPQGFESNLGKLYAPMYTSKTIDTQNTEEVQNLLNQLLDYSDDKKSYQVYVVESEIVNAVALPERKIIIYSELLKEIKTEDELVFVLAHELGHHVNKDHLRALGRRLVILSISSVFFGQDKSLNSFIGNSLSNTEMKFSQRQEKNADLFALKILLKRYQNPEGAIDFLEKIKKKHNLSKFFYFFSTHPHPQKRIEAIRKKIQEK
tara:strand:- start:2856 stop:3623 length:768 start_codon:yes stop_codon:yes gene_type:complete